jgi:two-component system response regulator HydG
MIREGKILIADDNEELLIALSFYLSPHFELIETVRNPNLIPGKLDEHDFDLVLLDMNFKAGATTGNEGFYWMRKILDKDPQASIVFITAYGDVEMAVKALKEGAADFIQKSWDEKKILSTIISAYKLRKSRLEVRRLKSKQKHLSDKLHQEYEICYGTSPTMRKIYDIIDKISDTEANILILGENGTGKEVIARQIHRKSHRRDELFVSVDLGSLNENLFESELFGHSKGAFTGARDDKQGRFELAGGGSLYLDEIGNIPVSLQSKLLSAIQSRQIYPLGSTRAVSTDIRLICSTNKPIYELMERGEFREDLLYRINTIQIDLPPLRERREDIAALADFFLDRYTRKYRKTGMSISRSGKEKLSKHSWYGNIRELEHVMEKAVILSEGSLLSAPDFSFHTKSPEAGPRDTFNLEENERRIIDRALKQYGGNISVTAKRLGINRSTLYDKIKKYEL